MLQLLPREGDGMDDPAGSGGNSGSDKARNQDKEKTVAKKDVCATVCFSQCHGSRVE